VNRKAIFLLNESIRIDSHNESNRIDSNRELECSTAEITTGISESDAVRHSSDKTKDGPISAAVVREMLEMTQSVEVSSF